MRSKNYNLKNLLYIKNKIKKPKNFQMIQQQLQNLKKFHDYNFILKN